MATLAAACALAEAEDWVAALKAFDAAVREQPTNAATHEQRAQVLLQLDCATDAASAASRAVELEPAWGEAWLTLGRSWLNAGAFDEAACALRRAASVDASLQAIVQPDLEAAERMAEEEATRTMTLHSGVSLRLRQWSGHCGRVAPLGSSTESSSACAPQVTGTGTMIWECGIVLAKLLDWVCSGGVPTGSPLLAAFGGRAPSGSLRGMRVVELGSGTGVAGLAAAALGASALLTDTEAVTPLLQHNVAANASEVAKADGEAAAEALDWQSQEGVPLPSAAVQCDLVLAADVLYQSDSPQLEALTATLARIVRPTSERPAAARLLLAHKSRHDELDARLPDAFLNRTGLSITEVPFEHLHPDFRSPSIHCFVGIRAC